MLQLFKQKRPVVGTPVWAKILERSNYQIFFLQQWASRKQAACSERFWGDQGGRGTFGGDSFLLEYRNIWRLSVVASKKWFLLDLLSDRGLNWGASNELMLSKVTKIPACRIQLRWRRQNTITRRGDRVASAWQRFLYRIHKIHFQTESYNETCKHLVKLIFLP